NVDAGGPLFADGPGANESIAALPLSSGYSTAFRGFDLQTQKVTVKRIKVVGSEDVTVPAGSFDAFKVEIASADGGPGKATLGIARGDRRVVKVSSVLPEANGATLTAELTR